MAKIQPLKPFLLIMYGYPGSGKTYFARQFSDNIQSAHLQADRIRNELFEQPRFDKQENSVVNQIMNYMCEEFLSAGVSVVYDMNAMREGQRRMLSNLALKYHVQPLIVWFQTDMETAFSRNVKRDKRKSDDRYAAQWDRTSFDSIVNGMQNPKTADGYVVVSGKHLFGMQQSAIVAKLRGLGSLSDGDANNKVIKPGMVNLIPNTPQGRVDMSRRNISVR